MAVGLAGLALIAAAGTAAERFSSAPGSVDIDYVAAAVSDVRRGYVDSATGSVVRDAERLARRMFFDGEVVAILTGRFVAFEDVRELAPDTEVAGTFEVDRAFKGRELPGSRTRVLLDAAILARPDSRPGRTPARGEERASPHARVPPTDRVADGTCEGGWESLLHVAATATTAGGVVSQVECGLTIEEEGGAIRAGQPLVLGLAGASGGRVVAIHQRYPYIAWGDEAVRLAAVLGRESAVAAHCTDWRHAWFWGPDPIRAFFGGGRDAIGGHIHLFPAVSPEDVQRCVDDGADPNARDGNGKTPLHWAVEHTEEPRVVQALLQGGADMTARDDRGNSPVAYALRNVHGKAEVLLKVLASEPPQIEIARRRVIALKSDLLRGKAEAKARVRANLPDLAPAPQEPSLGGNASCFRPSRPLALSRFNAEAAASDTPPVPDDALPLACAPWIAATTVAREAGFNNWVHLTRHLAAGGSLPAQGALAALVAAVERQDANTVREVVSVHPHLARARIWNADNARGDTLLHRADANAPDGARWENRDQTTDAHIEVARLLIEHGADVNASGGRGDTIGETPVGAAGWAGNARMVEFLLEHGANPTVVTDDWGFDALTTIAGRGHSVSVELIIAAGWPVEPRHLVQVGLTDRLAAVLDEEPSRLHERVDMGRFEGAYGTLLHLAASHGQAEAAAFLLRRGADPNAEDSHGRTPLQLVRGETSETIRATLLAAGAEVGIMEGVAAGDIAHVTRLLDADPRLVNHRRADGVTPLHLAIAAGRDEMASLLIERGADVHARNVAGEPPLR
ncbi:MAG: hypothetical protein F4Y26_12010 [Gammaproteobacteria bacterium]|nr:hypothetical protein [Gammaproteobacteria bacterium]